MAPDTINPSLQQSFSVGGVELPRPFRVRRLGHFGLDIADPEAGRRFYERLLGFRVSDTLEMGQRVPAELKGKVGPTLGYFSRHGTDHHSFVWFPRKARQVLLADEAKAFPEVTTNQITWQVGSLREVVSRPRLHEEECGVRIRRSGRDTPGSNWHFYPFDPEGHTNEILLRHRADRLGRLQQAARRCTRSATTRRPTCRTARNMPRSRRSSTAPPIRAPDGARRSGSRRNTMSAACCWRGRSRSCGSARCGSSSTTWKRCWRSIATCSASPSPRRSPGTAIAASSCAATPSIIRWRSIRSRCAPSWACGRIRR